MHDQGLDRGQAHDQGRGLAPLLEQAQIQGIGLGIDLGCGLGRGKDLAHGPVLDRGLVRKHDHVQACVREQGYGPLPVRDRGPVRGLVLVLAPGKGLERVQGRDREHGFELSRGQVLVPGL